MYHVVCKRLKFNTTIIVAFSLFDPYWSEQNGRPTTHLLGYFALKLKFKAVLNLNFESCETDFELSLHFPLRERLKPLLYPRFAILVRII